MSIPASRPRRSFRAGVSSFLLAIGGARECAQAFESGRRPSRRALNAVGIDEAAWDRIGKN